MPKCHRHISYTYHHRYGETPGANTNPAIDFTEALFPWYLNCGCTSVMRRPENCPTVYSMCSNESPWGPCGLMAMLLSVYMMPSSNGNIFRVTEPLCEEFTGGIPAQRSGTQRFIVHTHTWVSKRDAGDLIRHRADYDVTVMTCREVVTVCVLMQWGIIYWNGNFVKIKLSHLPSCLKTWKWTRLWPDCDQTLSLEGIDM